ncbi:MAG: ABC transporter substrate-binding protein [Flavonifractor plautii]
MRRAIDLALDKEALCLHTAQGLGEPAASDLTPGTGYDSGLTWARNVDGAKALLAEGGYDGRTYTLACTANRSGLAALMQQELAEAGITVDHRDGGLRPPCSLAWRTASTTWPSPATPPAPCPCGSPRAALPPTTTCSTWRS